MVSPRQEQNATSSSNIELSHSSRIVRLCERPNRKNGLRRFGPTNENELRASCQLLSGSFTLYNRAQFTDVNAREWSNAAPPSCTAESLPWPCAWRASC